MKPADRRIQHNRFIVFEGLDGAGTTTQVRRLHARLESHGHASWLTSEPTSGPVGSLCRRVLSGEVTLAPETIAHLFAADRCEHLIGAGSIREHLAAGEIVVCDRYKYSSQVYQGAETDPELVRGLNAAFEAPGLVIFLDISPEVADARLAEREHREIYERIEFQAKVRANYLREMAAAASETTVVMLDGTLGPDELAEKIWEAVEVASIL